MSDTKLMSKPEREDYLNPATSEEAPAEAWESLHPHSQPFEQYPELVLHIERMAMSGVVGSMISWDAFLRELNAALATREEAPAEAGEEHDDLPWPNTALANALHKHFSDLHGLDNEEASEEVYGVLDVIKAIRAQPPAREDAQPKYRCQKCGAQDDERYDCCEVYTRPAPDALRVAVEALVEAREDLFVKADKDEIPEQWASVQKIDQALAALQAEQKGGA